jgi:hypothetical protein
LPRRLFERFGSIDFELAIAVNPSGFALTVVGWRIDAMIARPWIGQLVRYRGWLLPKGA